jgi:hypothetical protein
MFDFGRSYETAKLVLVEQLIPEDDDERQAALDKLKPL